MKVIMYCLSSVSGGATSYLRNIAPLLSQLFQESPEGHELKYLAHVEQRELLKAVDERNVVWVSGRRPKGLQRFIWEKLHMSRIVQREKADVVFTPYQVSPRIHGLQHVLMLRNMEPFLFDGYRYSLRSRLRNYMLRQTSIRSLRGADRIIAVSDFARDFLTEKVLMAEERIRTVHHGRSVALLAGGARDEGREAFRHLGVGGRFILTCGSLLPYRRCEDVIAAFDRCAALLPADMQLVIAGSGTDRRYGHLIREMIAGSPYRERIVAVGHVPWETMGDLYRHCQACVIATEIEACPNIAIEAMAAGCAIISSGRPPLPEIFDGASLEFSARDIGDLAGKMRMCIENEELRDNMKKRALDRAEAFSWAKCAGETYHALTDWHKKEN